MPINKGAKQAPFSRHSKPRLGDTVRCTSIEMDTAMASDFTTLHNYYEKQVVDLVLEQAAHYPLLDKDHLPDVACVALNRLPPRYIRHQVDLAFHMTEKERQDSEQLIQDAVKFAFEFVQARYAMRARR